MNKFLPSALLATCALTLATPAALAQGTSTAIPGYNGGEQTPDGFFVAGRNGTGTFLWNAATGFTYSATSTLFPEDASSGGLRVAGDPFDVTAMGETPGYWDSLADTETTFGPHPGLGGSCSGTSNGSARVISNDGLVAAGLLWNGCDADPYKWDAANGYFILNEGAGTSSQVTAMSGDGSWFGGWSQSGSLSFETAYLWDSAGNLTLPLTRPENLGGNGVIRGMDFDGDSYVGRDYDSTNPNLTSGGFLMHEGTLTPIFEHSQSLCVSGDGRVVGGEAGSGPFGPTVGHVYTSWGGNMTALAFFAQFGVTPAVGQVDFGPVIDVSSDGNTFLVSSADSFFGEAVVISLPNNWTNLGGASAGINGLPTLEGFGWLNPGMTAGIALDNAASGTVAALAYGGVYNPTPIYGGFVGPFPWDGVLFFPTGANGSVEFTFTWPVSMPSGIQLFMQFGVLDVAGTSGIALSNTLQATGN
ncbi:MAG: hypothetical protein P1V81_03155 [Planctomycetota bacterium]|nr:hypothetical protein [Planctomycetota bacterium]